MKHPHDGAVAAVPAVPKGGRYSCPDCQKTFGTPHGLVVHRARMHGVGGPHSRNKDKRAKARDEQAAPPPPPPPVVVKRAYTRKGSTTPAPVAINFCPKCGCNIHAVSLAVGFASRQQ